MHNSGGGGDVARGDVQVTGGGERNQKKKRESTKGQDGRHDEGG